MILYHGSTVKVEKPSYSKCRPNTDFGKGFYTTTNLDQAVKWAKLKQQRAGHGQAVVSCYEVEDSLLKGTNDFEIMLFEGPDKIWLDFVSSNRQATPVKHYDIVFGPVANDRLFATIALYEQLIISAEAAIEQLKTHLLFDQVSFNSQKAIELLIYTGTEKII